MTDLKDSQTGVNDPRTAPGSDTGLTQPRSGSTPPRYELVDKDGNLTGYQSHDVMHLASVAKFYWPDQEQDPDRTGRGWDVRVVGAGDDRRCTGLCNDGAPCNC